MSTEDMTYKVRGMDLTGQRFGSLQVISPTAERKSDGGIVWNCICDCGNTCTAAGRLLVKGEKKSCGCLRRGRTEDYTGMRFGSLTVLSYAGKRGKWNVHHFLCQCDCGQQTLVSQYALKSGKTRSCGCLRAEAVKENLGLTEGTSLVLLHKEGKKPIATNTSGCTGVYQNKKNGKWIAQITFRRKTYYLGSFSKKEDAIAARARGEEMHEEFLRSYYEKIKAE